ARFRITHRLRYELEEPTAKAVLLARLRPWSLPAQVVEQSRLDVTPAPTARSLTQDEHGNRVESLSVDGPLRTLELAADSVVALDTAARRQSLLVFQSAAPPWPAAVARQARERAPRPVLESRGPVVWEAHVAA